MKTSKELLKEAGIQPKLRLGRKVKGGGTESTGAHRVKMLQDKIVVGTDPKNGKQIDYVRYLLEENGEKKTYQTKKLNEKGELSYLVQRLAEIPENTEVILEMKKQGIKNYIDVVPVGEGTRIQVEDDEEDDELGEDIHLDEPEEDPNK